MANIKIIYFTEDFVASPREKLEIARMPIKPVLRNAMFAYDWEDCDAVCGAVPDAFKLFPRGHIRQGQPVPNGTELANFLNKQTEQELALAQSRYEDELREVEAREKAKAEATKVPANTTTKANAWD